MIELIFLIISGVIVYSIFQSVLRGGDSDEKRIENPTLNESAANFSGSAAKLSEDILKSTKKYCDKKDFELKYCGWFKKFERSVSFSLDMAEKNAERESRFAVDPKLRKTYNEMAARFEAADAIRIRLEKPAPPPDLEWIKEGQPLEPQLSTDQEMRGLFIEVYQERFNRHNTFVKDVQKQLSQKPLVRKFFCESMNKVGLQEILKEYFPSSDSIRL